MFIRFSNSIGHAAEELRQSLLGSNLMLIHTKANGLLDSLVSATADDTSVRRVDLGDVDGYEAYLAARIGAHDADGLEEDYPEDRPDGLEDADTVYIALSVMLAVRNAQISNRVLPAA